MEIVYLNKTLPSDTKNQEKMEGWTLRKTGIKWECYAILHVSDSNGIRAHNHVVRKRTQPFSQAGTDYEMYLRILFVLFRDV